MNISIIGAIIIVIIANIGGINANIAINSGIGAINGNIADITINIDTI